MPLNRFNAWLVGLPRRSKCGVMMTADLVVLPLLMYLAFAVRLGTLWIEHSLGFWLMFGLAPLATLPVLFLAGFYRAVIRFLGSEMAWAILLSVSISSLLLTAVLFMGRVTGVPRSVVFIFWALSILYLGGSRFAVRRYLVWSLRGQKGGVPVAIYGAGGCGVQLASALSQASQYLPRFFVDDDERMQGSVIQGVRVIGRAQLANALRRYGVETVLLAMPSVSRQRRLDVMHLLEGLSVQVKSVPALPDVVAGRARIEDVHDIDIEDLLGRESVPPDVTLLKASVTGRSVMVTGAGGSIGSELCRQILAQAPARLVLFERNEYALYAIEQELRQWLVEKNLSAELLPVLASVVCRSQVESACREQSVQTVFHAAAYKHVPIVEANAVAGVENNVFGTLNAALAAEAAGVERFVLISTDKAVRSTNVMGATKRFSEMVLQALADRGSRTVFTMVRFGNVLGSSGSVVPLFRKQILAGGPVTLTHKDITRYFMTIPEAAQLVIQAGAMARGGEVFVLDMGEPVKIYDLACSMIRLMGYSVIDEANTDGDIGVRITGLRPGEKLYEELLICSDSTRTHHPMVMRANEAMQPWPEISAVLAQFEKAIAERSSDRVVDLLNTYVDSYHPADNGAVAKKVVPLRPAKVESA